MNQNDPEQNLNDQNINNYLNKINMTIEGVIDMITNYLNTIPLFNNGVNIKLLIQRYFKNNNIDNKYIYTMFKDFSNNLDLNIENLKNIKFKIIQKLTTNLLTQNTRTNTHQYVTVTDIDKKISTIMDEITNLNNKIDHLVTITEKQNKKIDILMQAIGEEYYDLPPPLEEIIQSNIEEDEEKYNMESNKEEEDNKEKYNMEHNKEEENKEKNKEENKEDNTNEKVVFDNLINNFEQFGKVMVNNFFNSLKNRK